METESLKFSMIAIALATPPLAGLLALMARRGVVEKPRPGRVWLLALAGPINLLVWLAFNRYLDGVGHRTAIGVALAALVFFAMGFGLGFLRRNAPQNPPGDEADNKIETSRE